MLGGLAAGYWVGGVLADRYPSAWTLAAVVGGGAVAVLLIPVLGCWPPGIRVPGSIRFSAP